MISGKDVFLFHSCSIRAKFIGEWNWSNPLSFSWKTGKSTNILTEITSATQGTKFMWCQIVSQGVQGPVALSFWPVFLFINGTGTVLEYKLGSEAVKTVGIMPTNVEYSPLDMYPSSNQLDNTLYFRFPSKTNDAKLSWCTPPLSLTTKLIEEAKAQDDDSKWMRHVDMDLGDRYHTRMTIQIGHHQTECPTLRVTFMFQYILVNQTDQLFYLPGTNSSCDTREFSEANFQLATENSRMSQDEFICLGLTEDAPLVLRSGETLPHFSNDLLSLGMMDDGQKLRWTKLDTKKFEVLFYAEEMIFGFAVLVNVLKAGSTEITLRPRCQIVNHTGLNLRILRNLWEITIVEIKQEGFLPVEMSENSVMNVIKWKQEVNPKNKEKKTR